MPTPKTPNGFVRMTNQRRVIIDVLKSTNSHPTAEWVFERVRERLPSISLATVYSNLRRLVELGEIQELHCGLNQSRYDGDTSNHAHFVCTRCQSVIDLPLEDLEYLSDKVREQGYIVSSQSLKFYGICPRCDLKQI